MGAQFFGNSGNDRPILTDVGSQVSEHDDILGKNQLGKDIRGKAVVDIRSGEKIGQVDEILFDVNDLRIAVLMISEGGLLNRQSEPLPAEDVQVWGKDVLLVGRSGGAPHAQMPDMGQLVKLSDQLKGRYVVSTDGVRVGQIDDVLVDDQGRLAGYELSQVLIKGRLAETKYIPVGATSSLGKDVLIVDLSKMDPG